MEQSVDVVDYVSSLLDSGKYKEALSVPIEDKYAKSFKDNCSDLISVIVGKIQNDTMITKPSMYSACEELLATIVQTASPEEALLEFIEQIEIAKNDAQFAIILEPLQKLLLKLSVKRGRSLEWCLNSISTYIEAIPIPEHNLEGKERILMDSDPNIRRIIKVYSHLPPFYSPFVKELETKVDIQAKDIISVFLISLLGKPLIYLDLDPDLNRNNEARSCCINIIQDISTLVKNILKLLPYVELHHKGSIKSSKCTDDTSIDLSPYEHVEKINITTLSGLFYSVFSGHFTISATIFPLVYSTEYVVHTVLLCVVHLLSFAEYGPLTKGITLCNEILNRYHNSSPHTLLTVPVHYNLCKNLMNLSIYSTYEAIRKQSVKQLSKHINKFEYKGRCLLIKYIINTANHSGMIGYAITLYKNSLNDAFNESEFPECFTNVQLMSMVKKMCHLPHGAESDLVELADQIITSLNFLRYLALKDRDNKTGIKECFHFIEEEYLEKLRTGLNMSKAHYELKLKDIEDGKNSPEKQVNVSVNVGGNILNEIPTESKKDILHSGLNAFHLIEGLVGRLSECISLNKTHE